MKIEIETATNGYIITIPPEYEDSVEKKIVIQELEYDHNNGKKEEFECFRNLVSNLQEIFGVNNSLSIILLDISMIFVQKIKDGSFNNK